MFSRTRSEPIERGRQAHMVFVRRAARGAVPEQFAQTVHLSLESRQFVAQLGSVHRAQMLVHAVLEGVVLERVHGDGRLHFLQLQRVVEGALWVMVVLVE